MRFSRNWLASYVDLPDDTELCNRLTNAGHNVDLTEALGDDLLLDVEITTNRPDCMNHFGLAREVAAIGESELRPPAVELDEDPRPITEVARVELLEPDLCPRYVAMVIEDVTVGPSPGWLTERLESIGQRSINNVVDITNFVLWELGQPLHAFDLDLLGESTIKVRRAAAGEKLTTLDDVERELSTEDLVIADASRPVALAGIMGGAETEVGESTKRVLLESAHFDRTGVRLSARRLGMKTDASFRFERGTDPRGCLWAAERAAALIAEVAGGRVLSGALDVRREPLFERAEIEVDLRRLAAFAGAEISPEEASDALQRLGLEIEGRDGAWIVRPPSWRIFDIERPEDVYEEAMRLYGFDRIAATLPAVLPGLGLGSREEGKRRQLRHELAAAGYCESIQFSFISPQQDAAGPALVPEIESLRLANPLSELYSRLRRSQVPGLVESARFNQRRGAGSVRLFELGHVWLDDEVEAVTLIAGGKPGTPWDGSREIDFFVLKGVVEELGRVFGCALRFRPAERTGLLPGACAEITLAGDEAVVGLIGQVAEEEGFPLFVAELLTAPLFGGASSTELSVPSRFPGVDVDTTLTHALEVSWAELRDAIDAARPADLVERGLKDRFQGKGVPDGAVNTTIWFAYGSHERSLTQEEVNERHQALVEMLQDRFGFGG